jgi:predicted short-subunit dehydrogenase-like oxidoreductase (DUF2520 family)
MKTPIIIIGWGKAAKFFAQRFSHLRIVAVATRTKEDTGKIKNIRLKEIKNSFEGIILMCVNDDSIAEVAHELNESNALICHCSGSINVDVLEDLASYGVFYPLQSISNLEKDEEVPLLIECENFLDNKLLFQLAAEGNFKAENVASEQRQKLHLAATFINNFGNHLFGNLQQYIRENELNQGLLTPLLSKTVSMFLDPEVNAISHQTGPALRSDQTTIKSHEELIADNTHLTKMYQFFTKAIQEQHN